MTTPVFKVRELKTRFFTEAGQVNAVDGVSFDLHQGEVLSVVGESGSGKSVTGLSLMDLIESPGQITDGEIWFHHPELAAERGPADDAVDGEYVDVRSLPANTRRSLCGTELGMIFQDPGSAFHPALTVGEQIGEAVESRRRIARGENYGLKEMLRDLCSPRSSFVSEESYNEAIDLLERVDIPDPIERADEYPHEFSGGMLQRAMVAQALASDPTVLVADEPTTGLDVTIQSGIIDLLRELQAETGMSIFLITHNIGVVSSIADRTAVMYGGEFFEVGPTERVLNEPANPYTQGLLNCLPDPTDATKTIEPIHGNVPSLLDHEMPAGCSYADRCPAATEECTETNPGLLAVPETEDHQVACLHAETVDSPTTSPAATTNAPVISDGGANKNE